MYAIFACWRLKVYEYEFLYSYKKPNMKSNTFCVLIRICFKTIRMKSTLHNYKRKV